ncbi:MAG: 5'/3'-nucleotidase SurE [Acidobacteria bacterium RIFCSPLOWO2_12_FULL_67_14b]|nr:MAG: 5'/3'-nucleotidase SurE [Acidobacteria bacterium RIFCSPLOWO2_12_FULL_67_14b]
MPLILVTNDDGVYSEGILALAEALKTLGDVVVVAPLQEASAIGHALTLRRPLRIETIREGVHGVDGTPTDCVNLGCEIILKRLPDLVVSGINKGWNLGDDITYSGTVSGALEAALLGSPGIAVSLKRSRNFDFGPAAEAALTVARMVLEKGLPPRTLLNINVPAGTPLGLRVTTQAKRNHVTQIDSRTDPRGNAYYWIEEALDEYHPDSGKSDYETVKAGYTSVTPLQPDMTAYDAIKQLEDQLG